MILPHRAFCMSKQLKFLTDDLELIIDMLSRMKMIGNYFNDIEIQNKNRMLIFNVLSFFQLNLDRK
jgi:hypothetical protein